MAIQSLRQLIQCATPLSGSAMVRDHLSAILCESLGNVPFIPIENVTISRSQKDIEINVDKKDVLVEFKNIEVDASIDKKDIEVAIETPNKEIDHECK